jgi:hypothetical protein
MSKKNPTSLSQYKKEISKNGHKGPFKAGYFYSYEYDFVKDPKNKELKYYDTMPLSFVYYVDKGDFWGLNVHHCPVEFREDILRYMFGDNWWKQNGGEKGLNKSVKSKIKKMFTSGGKPKATEFKKISKNYKQLMNVYSDVSLIVRRYKISRKSNDIRINPVALPELVQYTANTYHKSDYKSAMRNFYYKRSKIIEKELKKK